MNKLEIKKQFVDLGKRANVAKMPFNFTGKNISEEDVTLTIVAPCGCTVTQKEKIVKAGEIFHIAGYLKKRDHLGVVKKLIRITVKGTKEKYTLIYQMDLVKAG